MKISADLGSLSRISLWKYAEYCAQTLARAHARAGNPVAIAAHLAGSADFDKAVTRFARTYARVSKADYDAFCAYGPAASNGALKPAPLMVQP
jgi:hypothetical protein